MQTRECLGGQGDATDSNTRRPRQTRGVQPQGRSQARDPEYERLKKSLGEFGCVEPLVWNRRTGNLVGGHQRLKLLLARGDQKVVVSAVDLPPAKEKALNLALNKIRGDWDQDKLAALLDELTKEFELDLEVTGFDLPEAESIIAASLVGPDSLDEETFDIEAAMRRAGRATDAVTKPGDLITLGADRRLQHRLLCGDCTDPEQVKRLMGDRRAALFATDPPYLVGYDGTNHPGVNAGKKNKDWSASYGVTWDDASGSPDLYSKFLRCAVDHAIQPNAPFCIWHASRRQAMLEMELNRVGAFVHVQVIWVKSRPVLTRTWYMWAHEPCLMGWLKGKRPRARGVGRSGAREPMLSTVWHVEGIGNGPERPDHPTPKPTELFAIPMRQHTLPGEVCYEPFAGSGSQIIAAQALGRRCFATEISPAYCDVIVRRFIARGGKGSVSPEIARRYREQAGRKEVAA